MIRQSSAKNLQTQNNIADHIFNFDMFKKPFQFQLPNGFNSVWSFPGVCATYLLIILTIAYGTVNLLELDNYSKTKMRLDVIDYYYNDTDKFVTDKKPGL